MRCKHCGDNLKGGFLGVGGKCINPNCVDFYCEEIKKHSIIDKKVVPDHYKKMSTLSDEADRSMQQLKKVAQNWTPKDEKTNETLGQFDEFLINKTVQPHLDNIDSNVQCLSASFDMWPSNIDLCVSGMIDNPYGCKIHDEGYSEHCDYIDVVDFGNKNITHMHLTEEEKPWVLKLHAKLKSKFDELYGQDGAKFKINHIHFVKDTWPFESTKRADYMLINFRYDDVAGYAHIRHSMGVPLSPKEFLDTPCDLEKLSELIADQIWIVIEQKIRPSLKEGRIFTY